MTSRPSLVPSPFPPPVFDCVLYGGWRREWPGNEASAVDDIQAYPRSQAIQFLITYCMEAGGGNGLGTRLIQAYLMWFIDCLYMTTQEQLLAGIPQVTSFN